MTRRFVWLAVAALGIGLAVLVYRGPGHELARAHLGDAAATMLVYALLGVAWRARMPVRATVTLAIAAAIELSQVVWHPHSGAAQLLVGSTFDPWDLCAYLAGIAAAVAWEVRPRRRA